MATMAFKGNLRTPPVWAGDFGGREHQVAFPAKLDPTQFVDDSGIVFTVDVAGAAQGATTVPLVSLVSPGVTVQPLIAAGQILVRAGGIIPFGAAGSGKFARLTADAKYGDTSIAVEALPTALVSTDVGVVSNYNVEYIQSGRLLGRTYAEAASNTPFGPANVLTDEEVFLLLFDVANAKLVNDCELYRHHSQVKINYLPDYALMVADAGIVDPTIAPTLGHAGTDGSAGAGPYQVGYTFFNANGETKISPLATVTKLTTEHISVADIAFLTGATGIRFYASAGPTDPDLGFVKELVAHGATTLLTDGTGTRPPTANTTKGSLGSRLDWLRRNYVCYMGVD